MQRLLIAALLAVPLGGAEWFTPSNRLTGFGVERATLTAADLEVRASSMVEAQTFAILRDPRAGEGAKRITSPALQRLFDDAGRASGFPAATLAAIAYLESWGLADAQSPAGPKGIMQVSAATARTMGLGIVYATKYRITTERVAVKSKKGKTTYRSVRRKTPYQVLVRDERLDPKKAIPAAARYLKRLEVQLGGTDWAIFAYHCGAGCAEEMRGLTNAVEKGASVARMYFAGTPAAHRELYRAVARHMERDYSPTYWFRVRRAEQLLAMYREEPEAFRRLMERYRYPDDAAQRAPHRLSLWIREPDLALREAADLRRLERLPADAARLGFRAPAGARAAPAAIGTIAYLAFETRRLHQAMRLKGETFQPLNVVALGAALSEIRPAKNGTTNRVENTAHASGQVFDIDLGGMPPGQREALEFVLEDLGDAGYLGFIAIAENGAGPRLHAGCAPEAREFFQRVWAELRAAGE